MFRYSLSKLILVMDKCKFQMQRVDSMSEVVYGSVSRSCTTRSHPGSHEGKCAV